MFKTKLEVDRHVESCLKKINNEMERNLRCCVFAKLYFNVGDYEQAQRFVLTYLTAKPLSVEALNLLGKTLEKRGKFEAAIDAFRRSLDIDPKQNRLVLKVSELLSLENVNVDIQTLRSYCEKLQRIDPLNPIVYSLKERLVAAESQDPTDVTKLLLTELETRTTDVHLRIRLIHHLLLNNQIKEAYKHAFDIEMKNIPIFLNSLPWYEAVGEVLVRYQRENITSSDLSSDFWMLLVSVLDKLAFLILNIHFSNIKTSLECTTAVLNLDQTLGNAAKQLADTSEQPLVREFLKHYKAQLCFHLTCLLFKQAKSDLIKYKDALNLSLPLLFAAYHTQPPDVNAMWLGHSPENHRQQVKKWYLEATFRCSQAGHILQAAAKERKNALIEKATQNSTGSWREHLFKKLFITRDEQMKIKTSFFVWCQDLIEITFQLPDADLNKYDDHAQLMHPDSLHNLVWICLSKKLSTFKCTIFDGLQYSVRALNNCSANSLNVLDIDAFIYCAALTAQSQLEESRNQGFHNVDKPAVIPASITDQLCSLPQSKWLKAAYALYRNDCGVNFSEIRINLVHGIEVVRCVGNHGLDVKLLVMLANTFGERAKNLTRQSEIEFNEARAELYWKAAVPLLEKLQNNQAISYSPNRLFEYKSKEMPLFEILSYIDEAKLFNGMQLFKKKEYEKALYIFEGLKNPYASYHQAQIYKAMAEEQLNQNKENVTSEMRSQHIILLSRSRDCFYLTLDRLRDPLIDQKHPLNKHLGTDIEKIERLLSRIDSDIYNHRNECDGLSDENVSSNGSVGDHVNNFYTSTTYPMESLTPHLDRTHYSNRYRLELPLRREARPSPERLDAQLRQMQASRDATINHVLEQIRVIVDSQRTLMEEFRGFKDAMRNENEELQRIKDMINKRSASAVDEQSIRDVINLVHEIKKEIVDMKKDQAKTRTNQLSEEDLYALDDEYGTDYGVNSNVAAFNPANLYPSYQGRLPATYPPAALYPGVYPVYPYANLGLSQAGSIPFAQESQIPDFRALNLPQTLPQPNYGQPTKPAWDVVQPLNLVQPVIVPQIPPQTQQSNIFRDTISAAITTSVTTNVLPTVPTSTPSINKAPVNVVITSSDPLPKTTIATTQVLSVTIPPQHLKGNLPPKSQPHNYQIPLPTTSTSILNITPTVINQPPPVVTTQGLLSNIAPPLYSAIDIKNTGLGLQIEKTLNQSFSTSPDGKANLSRSLDEHDPCPDFKPIVPLPDEVPLNTGEENEILLFSERAKLFRYTNKEWRERGVGNIKILVDKDSGRVRIVMRRDQVHKICANHFLTKDMVLSAMPNSNRAFIWAANDFADQEMVLEKLCVRFKTEEEANAFFVAFENARARLPLKKEESVNDKSSDVALKSSEAVAQKSSEASTSLGGFIFTSTPTFKPKEQNIPEPVTPVQELTKAGPFASFSFSTKPQITNKIFTTPTPVESSSPALEEEKDFEPTAEFQPVVPLPALVEVKTGEENAEILFESHAKLLRYNTLAKEWKECGVGVMKLLKEHMIRLVMRRDQVLKLCCNHQLLKSMKFCKMPKNPKAVSWCAQDFSEGVLQTEMFSIRFKSEEQADTFYKAVTSAQDLLDDNNCVKSEEKVAIKEIKDDSVTKEKTKEEKKVKGGPTEIVETPKAVGWGDKFKPKAGTWKCKTCYIQNEGKDHLCVACDTPKSNATPKKTSEPVFSFGFSPPSGPNFNKSQFSFGPPVTTTPSSASYVFGQKPVSWGDTKLKESEPIQSVSSWGDTKPKESEPVQSVSSWGDAFKPKAGSWECQQCLIRNDADKLYCVSCEHPKDDTVPKKEEPKIVDSGSLQFSFGIPTTKLETKVDSTPKKEEAKENTTDTKWQFKFGGTTGFAFDDNKFDFTTKPDSTTDKFEFKAADESKDKFVFGSPQQHAFEFIPRSPRRHSSGCQGEEESDSFVEDEGDHIYFKPVVPLPSKIDVKTGEEQEEVLYSHRAKLFRFVDGEWKERGIGDIKILRSNDNGKLRVLMRRDQVLKICLNHALTSDIEYISKDDKTWLFSAPDYSEGEINHWRFCIRFKTIDISQAFKKAVDEALTKKQTTSSIETTPPHEDTSDVKFISETQVSAEEEQEAIRLQLPPKFMVYRQLPNCTCETCKEDDIILSDLFKASKPVEKLTEKFTFNKPAVSDSPTAKSETLKDILAKPKLQVPSSTENNAFNTFSFSLKTEAQTTPKSIFTQPTSQNCFANINYFTSSPSAGGSIFNTTSTSPEKSIFGSAKGSDIFTSANLFAVSDSKSLIGSTPPTFTEPSNVTQSAKVTSKENDEPVFKVDSNLSFASLSNMKSDILPFGKKSEEGDNKFAFLGSGAPVFAPKVKPKKKDKNKSHSGDEGEESEPEGGEEYDPHYEPIVPLPDTIVVSTGEEDEVSIFDERAKLFRYDNNLKEWKERGVGQMKILHHPINGTYRFILRREQVHKVVLNMLLTSNLELQPMVTSDKAWLWCGINHSDEGPQVEKLAIRFKNCELASSFYAAVQKAISALNEQQEKNLPSMIQNFGVDNSDELCESREDEEEEEEDEDDDYDDDERNIVCKKYCQLSVEVCPGQWKEVTSGDLCIYCDSENEMYHISMQDESGVEISNVMIKPTTEMTFEDNSCVWKAMGLLENNMKLHTLKAVFNNSQDAEDFHCGFVEMLQYTQETSDEEK